MGWLASEYSVLYQENGKFVKPIKILFCFGCMLAMLFLRPYDAKVSAWRPVKVIAFIGLISYSLYLTHTTVGSRVINLSDRIVGLDGLLWLVSAIAATIVSVIFGWLFFRWCEQPWLNPSAPKLKTPAAEDVAAEDVAAGKLGMETSDVAE